MQISKVPSKVLLLNTNTHLRSSHFRMYNTKVVYDINTFVLYDCIIDLTLKLHDLL